MCGPALLLYQNWGERLSGLALQNGVHQRTLGDWQ